MAPLLRIAVAQWFIKVQSRQNRACVPAEGSILTGLVQDLAPDENHAKACQYIRDAAADGAELVVLPE